ncbi:MAG: SpoIID/LytB domain-containing protein [Anaerohalosphaeraceae bacterium]|nr:SpoIID/LytB domain-containing protein [Anaerohalosphaeraceae bacterium]
MKRPGKFYIKILKAILLCAAIGGCIGISEYDRSRENSIPQDCYIRVCLLENIAQATISVSGGFEITNNSSGKTVTVSQGKKPFDVSVSNGTFQLGPQSFAAESITIAPQNDATFSINKSFFRGKLRLLLDSDKKSFTVINHVTMEAYLYGVIAAEMPSYWELEALKAQTVAARTYCFYIKNKFGKGRNWDVKATQANQVYKGIAAETSRTKNAVDSTFGQVLSSSDGDGQKGTFPAYYSSICGGHTEDSQKVFGDSYAPLAGVDCPYCRGTTRSSLFYWPKVEFDKQFVNDRLMARYPSLKKLEKIKDIVVKAEKDYGNFKRILSVGLIGTNGKTNSLRAEDLRLAIDPTGSKIQSTSCAITSHKDKYIFVAGRGFGHSTGLCQYGARQMAREKKQYRQILNFYYPGSKIITLY